MVLYCTANGLFPNGYAILHETIPYTAVIYHCPLCCNLVSKVCSDPIALQVMKVFEINVLHFTIVCSLVLQVIRVSYSMDIMWWPWVTAYRISISMVAVAV